MKDNKKAAYILLPVVIIIWAVIAYRIYSAIEKEDMPMPLKVMTQADTTILRSKKSEYTLSLAYTDPFLKNIYYEPKIASEEVVKKNTQPVVKELPAQEEKLIHWEVIRYHGMIENNNTENRIALITFNGESKLVRKGDQLLSFTIREILADSLKVRCQKEEEYIKKQAPAVMLSEN